MSSPTIGYDDVAQHSPPVARDDRLPTRIGRYVVLDIVGVGGMGVVCTAYDPKLDRKVALKLLRQRDHDDPSRITVGQVRLQREARALAKLKHPNVVAVHDVDIVDGRLYIAMEYVEGEAVSDWMDRSVRGWREVVEVFIQAAKGLVAAHAAGITHRDFKPANVRLESTGRVVVLDFGLALAHGGSPTADDESVSDEQPLVEAADGPLAERNRRLTAAGRRVGTPAYMSPEQILGHAVGPATDQFAFGASLYEALYGALPFRGDANTAMWNAVEGAVAAPPRGRDVPPWLHRIVLRLLDREPQGRYGDMNAVIVALSQGLHRRRRGRIAAAGVAGVIGLGGLGWAWRPEAECPGAAARVDARWDVARRDALARDFVATGAPFAAHAAERTIAVLDGRTEAWKAAHVEVCEATRVRGEQSDALLDHRMACLDAALLEIGALVDVFAETDAKLVEHAVVATMGLSDPRSCLEYRPDDADAAPRPEVQAQVDTIREQIAHAHALVGAKRVEAASAAARGAWEAAASVDHPPTRVEAAMVKAASSRLAGDLDDAEQTIVAAIGDAATHHLFEAEADAWIQHLQVLGQNPRRPDRGPDERLAAEAAVARAGSRPKQAAGLAHALGVALSTKGDLDAAVAQLRTAIDLRVQFEEPDHPSIARARNDLGIALARLGRHREAEEAFRAALESHRRSLGSTHPAVADNSLNLGNVVAEGREDWDECAALYADALAIREAVFGPNDPAVAEVLVAQGALARRRGDHRAAVEALRRAVELFGGPQAKDLRAAMALNTLGTSHMALDDAASAVVAFTEALALLDREGATRHPSRLRAFIRRCGAHAAAGHADAARADCASADELLARMPNVGAAEAEELARARASIAGDG